MINDIFISVVMGQKCNAHILVGTPKELVSMRILGGFDMEKVNCAVFDDADVVVTSDMVQRHLVKALSHAQVVLTSTTICSDYGIRDPISIRLLPSEEVLVNVSLFFIKCSDNVHKFDAARQIIDIVYRKFDDAKTRGRTRD